MKNMTYVVTGALVALMALAPLSMANEPVAPVPADSNMIAECGMAMVVLVVGAIVYIKLKQLCDAKLGPPGTGTPPPTSAGSKIKLTPSTSSQGTPALTLNMSDSSLRSIDISAQGYTDGLGYPYYASVSGTIMSSTNMAAWLPVCTVTGWVSPATIVFVCYTNGVPTSTNWGSRTSAPIACDPHECGPMQPQRYFQVR